MDRDRDTDLVASGYDAFYEAWGRSPALQRIWRDHVTGTDFPDEFAHISFLSATQLRELVDGLALTPEHRLVDLACGAGGPGLWASRRSGARLVGVDLSAVAVRRAAERAASMGMADTTDFRQGRFDATGLETASLDAAMSVDALQYAPDKARAFAEIARIVRSGGRFAFVAFELAAEQVAGLGVWDDPVGDYRPLLAEAGFDVVAYDQLPDWRAQVEAGFGAVLAEQEVLEAELGPAAAAALAMEATITLQLAPYRGHVLAVTRRT